MQPKPTKTTPPRPDPLAAIVDEIGDLEAELKPLKPKQARLELLRKSLRSSYDDHPAAVSFLAAGTRYIVAVGACGDQTIVDAVKLLKLIGPKAFALLAKPTVASVEALAPEVQLGCVSKSLHTGPRTLKVMQKGIAAA